MRRLLYHRVMALAHSVPRGFGARSSGRAAEFLARPRQTTVKQLLGWLGLAGITALWLQALAVSLRIHSLISAYESAHGPALAQWEGRAPRAPELDQLVRSLEGIKTGTGTFVALELFPVALLVLFGFWVGCSRWAFGHRLVAWRRTFVLASLAVLAQTILLYPAIDAFTWITN